jgi:hypothetical protein
MISKDLALKATFQHPDLNLVYGLGNKVIREYDMRSAGLSVIREYGLLSKSDIRRLEDMDKEERNITVGKIRALDSDWSKLLTKKIRETMAEFMRLNEVEDDTLISINNDAITVIEPRVKKPVLEMGSIKFRCDGEFTALAVVNRIQIFMNKGSQDLTIRGIGEHGREHSSEGVGKKLLEWLRLLEVGVNPLDVLKKVQMFRKELIEHTAPQDMYRSLRTGFMTLTGTPSRFSRVRLDLPFDDPAWEELLDPTETLVDIIIPFGDLLIEKSRQH